MAGIKSYSEDSLVTDLTGEIVESGKKFPYVALKKEILSVLQDSVLMELLTQRS